MTEVARRAKLMLIALIVAALAAAGGYQIGQSASTDDRVSGEISADLLIHKGNSAKSCQPQGKYGKVKNQPAHCDGQRGK